MVQKEIAIISDIHGNSIALEEVLVDIKSREISTVVNLGDSLYGPLDPLGTYNMLIENKVISISGNQDRFILENIDAKTDILTLEYVKTQINDKVVEWLELLSFDIIFDNNIYYCHASPQCDTTYLLESIQTGYVTVKDELELEGLLTDIKQNIIACGHSHVSRIVKIDNKTIINSGSVGLPAYDDDLPIYHKMENFSPHASYVVLRLSDNSVNIDQVSLSYDFEKAARLAETNKRDDWAKWIRSGRI